MATMEQPFFDPVMAELQRRTSLQVEQGTADLQLQGQRLTEDYNLMLGTPEAPGRFRRQMAQDMRTTADSVAGRGFHGQNSGVMRNKMKRLGTDQTDALAQFQRNYSRSMEDIQREIANLEQTGIITGAEGTLGGAGRSSDRLRDLLPW